jgi:hypothetical protein
VDEVVIDRDLLVPDAHRVDLSHREFVVVHQGAMNFHREQASHFYRCFLDHVKVAHLMVDHSIFFAEDVRMSFLEIPFVTPSSTISIYVLISYSFNKNILEK